MIQANLKITSQSGASFVELLMSIGLLTFIFAGVAMKMKTMKATLASTTQMMSLDALESSLSDFSRNHAVLKYSLSKVDSTPLTQCLLNLGPCINGDKMEINLYREGQRQPFTGIDIGYDRNGVICTRVSQCQMIYVRTYVSSHCLNGTNCPKASYILVTLDLYAKPERKPVRTFVQEVERRTSNLFPAANIGCTSPDQVLYGIGLQGDALCIYRSQLALVGKPTAGESVPISVEPVDCRTFNTSPSDQFSVTAIDSSGKIFCKSRFW